MSKLTDWQGVCVTIDSARSVSFSENRIPLHSHARNVPSSHLLDVLCRKSLTKSDGTGLQGSATYNEEIKRHVNEFAFDLGEQFFDLFQIQSFVRNVSSLRRGEQNEQASRFD